MLRSSTDLYGDGRTIKLTTYKSFPRPPREADSPHDLWPAEKFDAIGRGSDFSSSRTTFQNLGATNAFSKWNSNIWKSNFCTRNISISKVTLTIGSDHASGALREKPHIVERNARFYDLHELQVDESYLSLILRHKNKVCRVSAPNGGLHTGKPTCAKRTTKHVRFAIVHKY